MKKTIFIFFALIFLYQNIEAQSVKDGVIPEETPVRTLVVMDFFVCPPTVPIIYMSGVRQGVMAAFLKRGRNDMLDAEKNFPAPMYNNAYYGYVNNYNRNPYVQNDYQITSPNQSDTPISYFDNGAPRDEVKKTGARYVVNGYITQYILTREVNSDKKVRFTSRLKFVLSTYDIKNSIQLETKEFSMNGSGFSQVEADKNALKSLQNSIGFYINDNFKFKIKGLYLNCGTAVGVKNGDLFQVYALDNVGGVEMYRHIGRVRARQTMSDVVTFCSFSAGTADIVSAFNGGAKMIAVSAGEAIF